MGTMPRIDAPATPAALPDASFVTGIIDKPRPVVGTTPVGPDN